MGYSAEQIYVFIDHFTNIEDSEPNGEDVVTFYVDNGKNYIGFVENTRWDEGGIHKFICRKWILQTELDKLLLT